MTLMKRKTIRENKSNPGKRVLALLATMCLVVGLVGCQLPEDPDLVPVETIEAGEEHVVQIVNPLAHEVRSSAGYLLTATLREASKDRPDLDQVIRRIAPTHTMKISKETLEAYFEQSRKWQVETMVSAQSDVMVTTWDETTDLVSSQMFTPLEEGQQTQLAMLKNPYLVPFGVSQGSWSLKKSALYEGIPQQGWSDLETLGLRDILSAYYGGAPVDRDLYYPVLLSAAAEKDPMTYPTLLRLHHGRLDLATTVALVEEAMDLRDQWQVRVINGYGSLVSDEFGFNSLTLASPFITNTRDIMVMRPMWEDPVIVGYGLPKTQSDDSMLEAIRDKIGDGDFAVDLYQMAGGRPRDIAPIESPTYYFGHEASDYYPVDPALRDRVDQVDLEKFVEAIPPDVKAARDFYDLWLANGPWDPTFLVTNETRDAHKGLMEEIRMILTHEGTFNKDQVENRLKPYF